MRVGTVLPCRKHLRHRIISQRGEANILYTWHRTKTKTKNINKTQHNTETWKDEKHIFVAVSAAKYKLFVTCIDDVGMLHKMSLDYMYTVNDEILQILRAKGKKKC
jgi:hypothetical protein